MTSRPAQASSKRQTSTSSIPVARPQCKIHSTATIADKAQLTGAHHIEIGEHAFIHPHAKIRAEYGNVVIGKNCIISEKAVVGLAAESTPDEAGEEEGEADIVLGEGVSIESGALVEARRVGEYSTIEINARVGRGAVVGRWCKVAPLCVVGEREVLEDFTVVFADGKKRVDCVARDRGEVRDARVRGREKEEELLRGLIADASAKWRA